MGTEGSSKQAIVFFPNFGLLLESAWLHPDVILTPYIYQLWIYYQFQHLQKQYQIVLLVQKSPSLSHASITDHIFPIRRLPPLLLPFHHSQNHAHRRRRPPRPTTKANARRQRHTRHKLWPSRRRQRLRMGGNVNDIRRRQILRR